MKKINSVGWLYMFMFAIAFIGALFIRAYQLSIIYIIILFFLIFIINMFCLFLVITKKNKL
ncbi:hypothetical protein SAMN03080614_10754 [Anaerobranca gottschalkii DSM 13577]|uniref:Uncharacterized protein n=1 Tax=Anaerobranca gottschalkii DSM 13577 TaxID=1120990 RepID=A0A1I0CHN9_9FIRM|nr:hypothetical protein SAMN03080614_10754 [Anaerobranca gottschalkii DSM 13577]